ncbi:MAG: glycosyltransferase family 9 protein [Candidatus Omnitrophica bacterium]|nr:glycosyltransferase family 9 protein [Candidatus Omnitrophota bacterium]
MCPRNISKIELKNILIIGLSCLGDNLLITPAIKKIKDTYKNSEIDIVVGQRAVDFVFENPWFSNYFIYNKKDGLLKLIKKLRQKKYDLIVDFRNSLIPFFLKSKYRLTFFKNELFSEKFYTHESERIMNFLEPFFGKEVIKLYFPIGNNYREKIRDIFHSLGIKQSDLLVVLNPGAKFEEKRWDKEKFSILGKELIKNYGVKIIITGSKDEEKLTEEVKELINEDSVFNFGGKTNLKELAAIFERSDLVVTNDTGSMHLACAVGASVVAIFGPSNPYRYGPIGARSFVVHSNIDCFPCKRESKCKIGFKCIKEIEVDDVLKYCFIILDEKQQPQLFEI